MTPVCSGVVKRLRGVGRNGSGSWHGFGFNPCHACSFWYVLPRSDYNQAVSSSVLKAPSRTPTGKEECGPAGSLILLRSRSFPGYGAQLVSLPFGAVL